MAKRVMFQMVDDVDGSVYADGAGESIGFAVDGVEYVIDLKAKNVKDFRGALGVYVEHATRVGGRKRKTPATVAPRATAPAAQPVAGAVKRDPEQLRAIRQWATDHGHQVSDRGRISAVIQEAFDATH